MALTCSVDSNFVVNVDVAAGVAVTVFIIFFFFALILSCCSCSRRAEHTHYQLLRVRGVLGVRASCRLVFCFGITFAKTIIIIIITKTAAV